MQEHNTRNCIIGLELRAEMFYKRWIPHDKGNHFSLSVFGPFEMNSYLLRETNNTLFIL